METVFYLTRNGRRPAKEFIEEQEDPEVRVAIYSDIERLEKLGHMIRRPFSGELRDGIFELRTLFKKVKYRLFYFYHSNRIIITHGFKKKVPKVPNDEINKANKYRNDYISQQNEKREK